MSARIRRIALALLLLLSFRAAGDEKVTPTVLKPDAELPPVDVRVDLGERAYEQAQEQEHSKEVVKFYTEEVGLVEDAELQQRIETIGHRIITAAHELGPVQVRMDKPKDAKDGDEPFTFTFHIVDSDEINAFSAWGGNIFITRGMVEFCQSDHELAGIVGHEVAHSTYHHLRGQYERVQRYETQRILAMIAAAFMGINVAHAATVTQYLYLAMLNGHSVENESEADMAGVYYTYRAGYNPVGLITVFERLHRLYLRRPMPEDLGAFQTHPWSDDRARSMERQIRALNLPVERRDVVNAMTADVRVTEVDGGDPTVELLLGDDVLMPVAEAGAAATAIDRADDVALVINREFRAGMRSSDLRLVALDDHFIIRSLRRDLVDIRAADARAAGTSLDEFAHKVYNRFLARCRNEEMTHGPL